MQNEKERTMKKTDVNVIINVAAFILFLLLASTGLLIWLVLPSGHGYLTIWGMNRHVWGDIHFWIALSFLVLIVIHLILHWSWIKSMLFSRSNKPLTNKNKVMILFIIFALIAAAAPFFSPVESTRSEDGHQHQREQLK
jgi:hypothetical protein